VTDLADDQAEATEPSHDPRTGAIRGQVAVSSPSDVESVLAAAASAAPVVAAATPSVRAGWLRAGADALTEQATASELVYIADAETALGEARLSGELARAASQLRFYADVAVEGSWLRATIDPATEVRSSLARVQSPLGPVAVFGAGNFPFGFGVLGNDTASALAAGCPVVAKTHPAHPELSARLASVAVEALSTAGAPAGAFALVAGFEAGATLVQAPQIRAVGFTGSQRGGIALWKAANEREVVIPVYAEMGTVNPVLVTPEAVSRMDEIAAGLVGSFTLGTGQFCTKPGLLLAPAGAGAAEATTRALDTAGPRGWHLTEGIAAAASAGVEELAAAGARVVARCANPQPGWSGSPVVLIAKPQDLVQGSRLLEECFGPVVLICEYDSELQLETILSHLQGCLTASVMTSGPGDPDTARMLERLAPLAGRVSVDEWPTGVAWTWAQQHGGPWPATSAPAATSVGASALDRFTRPIAYQNAPDHALPPALKAANPWRLPRRIDGQQVLPGTGPHRS